MNTRKSLIWSFSQQFGQLGLQFIGSIVIARLLTPNEMGVFALAMATQILITALREFGVGSYLIREEKLDDDKIRSAFGAWIAISWTLGLLVLFVRHPVAGIYDSPGIADVLLLLSVTFFITPLGQPAHALLTREMRFDILHHIGLATTIVQLGISIALAVAGFSFMALAWGMVASTVVRSALLMVAKPNHLKMLPSIMHWRGILSFGSWMTGVSLVGTLNTEGVKFILGGVINPGAVAVYERSLQIPLALRAALTEPVGRVLFPAYASEIRKNNNIDESFYKVSSITNIVLWPALFSIMFLSLPITLLLFGENWRVAGEIMPYMILARVMGSLVPNYFEILVAAGRQKLLLVMSIIITGLNILSTYAVAQFGIVAFSQVHLAIAILAAVIFYFTVRPVVKFSHRRFIHIQFRTLFVTITSSLPAAIVYILYDNKISVSLIFITLVLCGIAWIASIFLVRHEIIGDLRDLISSLKIKNAQIGR